MSNAGYHEQRAIAERRNKRLEVHIESVHSELRKRLMIINQRDERIAELEGERDALKKRIDVAGKKTKEAIEGYPTDLDAEDVEFAAKELLYELDVIHNILTYIEEK